MAYPVGIRNVPQTERGIQRLINDDPLVIFGMSFCEWCDKTAKLLKPWLPTKINIDLQSLKKMMKTRKALKKVSRMNTFPQVFLKGKLIGGYENTVKAMKRKGTMKKLNSIRGY
jgi:glutaredoxin